jgi:glutamate--cysteine ligase
VREAINTPSEQYRAFPSGENGQWEQLNDNVLQIENELYSPIRPKQVARSLEKPSDALEERGVSYIEVRALDVNPFSPLGIEENQFYFLDVFLLFCLLDESPKFEQKAYEESEENLNKVVLEGRKPGLMLTRDAQEISLVDWAEDLFEDLREVAKQLDSANGNDKYSASVEKEFLKVQDPMQTPSARWLNTLIENNIDNSRIGLELALEYKKYASGLDYLHFSEEDFKRQAKESIAAREQIEKSDKLDFADFIDQYFAR